MKIYHTRTKEDYDTLMVELDKQGCAWEDGDRLSVFNAWNSLKGDTYIKNDGRLVTYDTIETYERLYPNTPIIEYTAEKQGEKKMKIYHVKTQADYDALMIELEEKGCKWNSGYKPTSQNYWSDDKEKSCIKTSDKYITFGAIEWHKKNYPDISIIEYKADKQGEKQMKIYNTRTQSDYDALMIKLEEKGYEWISGDKPTYFRYWEKYGVNTCIEIVGKEMTFGSLDYYKEEYPNTTIIEYKADKKEETDDFIKELTVKIYYNEVTKKHYNSYEDAIADCKKEMERQHDKN